MTARATTVSPYMDMLRHRYEAGAQITDLAHWFNISRRQMKRWLAMAGTEFRTSKREIAQ